MLDWSSLVQGMSKWRFCIMYRGFSGERLVSVMEWFFHSLGEAVSRFQDEVVCGGQGCCDKVETLGKYLSLNGG